MALDPRIILAGQPVNVLGAVGSANQMAAQQGEFQHQNALRSMLQQNGPGIMAGDQQALGALSRFDPNAAFGIKADQERLQMARAAAARAAASAKDQARLREEVKMATGGLRNMAFALKSGDQRAWRQMAAEFGAPDLPMDASSFALLASTVEGLDEGLRQGMVGAVSGPGFDKDRYRVVGNALYDLQAEGGPALVATGQGGGPVMEFTTPDGSTVRMGTNGLGNVERADLTRGSGQARIPDQDSPTGSRIIAEPGSDADKAAQKAQLANVDYERKYEIVESNIDQALAMLREKGRGVAGYGSLLSNLPESAARDFKARLDTIKANLGFEELQAMRDSSPTGGALGQVTEREIAFLQAIQGNLDAAQSPQQLEDVLTEIRMRRAGFAAERRRILSGGGAAKIPEGVDPGLWEFMTDEEKALFQ